MRKYNKHGLTSHPLYVTWLNMRGRCNNPSHPSYKDYGGRGIKVCERWSDFANFLEDMGECPEGLTLERKNNDLGYNPDNCKWATRAEQQLNQRLRNDNKSGHKGVYWYPKYKKWQVQVKRNGVAKTIGYFKTKEEAVIARNKYVDNLE